MTPVPDPTRSDRLTISRILKVNHAGEYGAIRIYRAQLLIAHVWHRDLIPFLSDTLAHEIKHCQQFREAMRPRQSRPCLAMSLWSVGGYSLGLITALMGRNIVMACTKAVEQTVHRHLDEQIRYLNGRDDELRRIIEHIQIDEVLHLDYASQHMSPSVFSRFIVCGVALATESVIWLSTQGAVSRMIRDLR